MRVLLVEDDPTTSKSIELMLGNANLNVYSTDLGEEGIDLAKLQGKSGFADGFSSQLANLSAEHQGDRLQRLERSVLRLERANVQTLGMLKKLVNAVKRTAGDGEG